MLFCPIRAGQSPVRRNHAAVARSDRPPAHLHLVCWAARAESPVRACRWRWQGCSPALRGATAAPERDDLRVGADPRGLSFPDAATDCRDLAELRGAAGT